MPIRGSKRATAVAIAVVGGLLATPGAVAAPTPGPPAGTPADHPGDQPRGRVPADPTAGQNSPSQATLIPGQPGSADSRTVRVPSPRDGLPAVWPRPQSATPAGPGVRLGADAVLVAPPGADPYALELVRTVLRAAGVRTLSEVGPNAALPAHGTVVRVQGTDAERALRALGATEAGDLPSGGYRLAVGKESGRDTVALVGTGPDGLFHAAQTLRQLAAGAPALPGVVVRDWPSAAVRGTTEGFYGEPWTREQRLAHLDFMGRTKQNRYLYAPGDDPFRTARWREPYPAAQQEDFRALAARAAANHVTLGWAVAPGQTMCLSSAGHRKALLAKLESMWALGVRAFQLQFQDVSYTEWCGADRDRYGSGPEAAAEAHAELAGAVARELARRHPGSAPLSLMPTEYYQDGATRYRTALAQALDPRIEVAWTGIGVVPRTITGGELTSAREVFGHPLVTMDNYPVNDYAPGRLFLGPATGRDPAVAGGSAGLLSNAMQQAAVSRIPLFTAADFAWNPRGYQPAESWSAALDELAGGDARAREALGALAGNTASSVLGADESAYLRPLLAEFWAARAGADRAAQDRVSDRLRAAFTVMREARERLAGPADGGLGEEAGPWIDQLARYGAAGERALDLLRAQGHGDGAAAWRDSLALAKARKEIDAEPVTVGKGVLGQFLAKAAAEADAWTGADRRPAGPVARDAQSYTVPLGGVRPVEAVTVMAEPASGATGNGTAVTGGRAAAVEAHVPGEGWRKVGELSPTGWTQAPAAGLRADAVRVVWAGAAPALHTVVPWYADEPAAGFELAGGGRADAEIGGAPQRLSAELSALRPGAVRGALTARAPHGIQVRVPGPTTVPWGSKVSVPVEVVVPAGTPAGAYDVPVSFGGEQRTLTVRAFPRTGGPDLLAGRPATSSGDETPGFPAAAATDASPTTRWSSPAADGEWWQAELASPTRVGRVSLHWQDAHPSSYRVQVSTDGSSWRTAATVAASSGGRESVRMDEPAVRYVRVVCDTRATDYGCSLYSASAYAVAP
ncbi:beta-N-acetylglucosaminidase domain-containing protein [Streptomyces sp. NPDC089919]|uniref:beta-N-acetylglucosaminidase domain-containing protein n=1 Tax=Streptomyces sp. NPDC089919 TaxID=3155188 RepID=UPI00343F7304